MHFEILKSRVISEGTFNLDQSTEVRFASFFSGGFITTIEVNPLERNLAKRTSVQSTEVRFASYLSGGFTTI